MTSFGQGEESSVSELLELFTSRDQCGVQVSRLKELLRQFIATHADGKPQECFQSSDPHSVASLLVQQLLTHFSQTFLPPSLTMATAGGGRSLRDFLCQDMTMMLLISIQIICLQVDATYPELAELMLVVLRTLLSKSPGFEVDKDAVLDLIPLYRLVETETPPTTNAFTSTSFFTTSTSTPECDPLPQGPLKLTIVPRTNINQLLKTGQEVALDTVSDRTLYHLVLSVIESTAIRGGSRTTSQVSSTLHLIQGVTSLFEEVIALWLQSHNQDNGSKDSSGEYQSGSDFPVASSLSYSYKGMVHLARVALRLWLILTSQVLQSTLSTQQLSELKPLLFAPIGTVSTACYNLQRAGLFRGNECLDHEFTLIVLETLFSCLHAINLLAVVPVCSPADFFQVLKDCLTDGCHEWFAYLCSKLHGISESGMSTSWKAVMSHCHKLLIHILRELILASSHIQDFQKASKSALVGEWSARPVVYSLEVSTGFDKLTQRLSKIAQLLLDVFRSVPLIQLLSLQLLSESAKDIVGIIGNFLKNLSDASVWSNPEVVDLYLELLERVWFRLSPDYSGSASWWKKLANYSTLLQVESREVVHQVLYHIQCLFSHESTTLKSQLTKYVILPFNSYLMSRVKRKVYKKGGGSPKGGRRLSNRTLLNGEDTEKALGNDLRTIISLFLKLLLKVVSNQSSLSTYLTETSNIYSLFLLLPIPEFRSITLNVIEECIKTLRKLTKALSRESEATTQRALLQILLKLAFMIQVENIPDLCVAISEGKAAFSAYSLQEVDQVHLIIQDTFEHKPLAQLWAPSFVRHLAIVADVWDILARLATQDDSLLLTLSNNHVWDVIQIFAPSLGSLLARIQQRSSGGENGGSSELGASVHALQEIAVLLLCHLLMVAHTLCWRKKDLKVLQMHCSEVQHVLKDSHLCSISNSHLYCTALLKAACCYSQIHETDESSPGATTPVTIGQRPRHSERSGSYGKDRKLPQKYRPSKKESFSSSNGLQTASSFDDRSWSMVAKPSSLKSWVLVSWSDSDLSGYEADVERGVELEESCEETADESHLLSSLTSYLVPLEVQQRLWSEIPMWHCVELLRESMKHGVNVNCEKSVEVFLYQLYGLLKADHYNVALLSGKGLLDVLLDSFAPLFELESERSITCCRLICHIAEVVATHQISPSETRKLFLRLQTSKIHLEKLPSLLRTIATPSSEPLQPSAFVEFTYNKPVKVLSMDEMLKVPYSSSWKASPRTIVMWFYVSKYPLQALLHILSVCTGEYYLQVWACACSGDIIIRLRPELQLDFHSDRDPYTLTIGSIIVPGQWHNLTISVLPYNMQPICDLVVIVDGNGAFHFSQRIPLPFSAPTQTQYYIAGGAISVHTSEHHLRLVRAEKLSWKLGSLHVLHGFSNPSLATIIYELGPDCACSNRQAVETVSRWYHAENAVDTSEDTHLISKPPVSNEELELLLKQPFLAYSAHNPRTVFLLSLKQMGEEGDVISVPYFHELQWVSSANAVTRRLLLDVINSAVGIEQLVYLYAKVVSEGCSEIVQYDALSLLRLATHRSLLAALEFAQLGGMRLIQQVLRTPQAATGNKIVEVFLTWCCDVTGEQVKDPVVLRHILLDWRIWHKAPEGVWEKLLWKLEQLLTSSDINRECFHKAEAIVKILLTGKERTLENLSPLPPNIACLLVRLIECLLANPPQLDCVKYICDYLLVSDLNNVKFVVGNGLLDASMSVFDGRRASTPVGFVPVYSPSSGSNGDPYTPHGSQSPLSPTENVFANSVSDSEPEELIAFDVKPGEGRLPDSSYSQDDSLFTWTDITGMLTLKDSNMKDDVPTSIEVGLLGLLRKVIELMPDSTARRVIGQVIQHESLLAIAHHQNVVVRTAVVRVLDAYFQRGGDGVRTNFVQVKGFNLLASQLKLFKVSFELMSALCSVIVGQEISLKGEQVAWTFQIPNNLSGFHMHAVIPVLHCVVNAISQPRLCHTLLCILRELFETVKGMPLFMLNNGLLKLLCQLIAITTDHAPLSRDDKELILTDVLQLCKLVAISAISAEQEEQFRMLENLIVCLRHCSEEISKAKGPHYIPVIYLHQFQYFILAQALRYFHEDMDFGGYVPTLPSSSNQTAGPSDLTGRFTTTCTNAVDWAIYGAEPYNTEHAQYFEEDVTMPMGIAYDPQTKIAKLDVAFSRFLLHYFHKVLLPVVKKGNTLNLERQRYTLSSRTHLNEQLCRLFGYLISPIHNNQVRCAVLKDFWELEDSHLLFNFMLISNLKKLLSTRLVLMVVHLMKHDPPMDSTIKHLLKETFEAVCQSGNTRLKATMKLTSFLAYDDEVDTKKKHKYGGIMEEMKNAEQRWGERYEFDVKGFAQRRSTSYSRLVEKNRTRQQVINRVSSSVTHWIFDQQSLLRRSFLEQISQAGMCERDTLHQWRRVIMINTHPRALWSRDEARKMCWQLDPTEGPSRVRRRMMKAPRTVDERHLLPEARTGHNQENVTSPLQFIFENTAYHSKDATFKKIVPQEGEDIITFVPWRCSNISPDNICRGNLMISNIRCYFVGDEPLGDPNLTKVLPWDEETMLLSWGHRDIVEIHRRRHMLKNNALEIFLINGKTMMLAFESPKERNSVHTELLQLDLPNLVDGGESESEKLKQVTLGWQQGEITNFEYLMELNKLAGRTFNDLMQYPVFPFILADYKSPELDLRKPESFRRLGLPISIQDDNKRQKYLKTYNFLAKEGRSGNMAAPGLPNQTSKPYHYGSHYSNSGIVLHFMVRMPPFTDMFLAFQGRSFDIADRTFRDMATTWWLSSSESATDVKELIPAFFYLPEFLVNSERYDFGECQTGERVDNVSLPPWAKENPRLFVFKHRQALESEYVTQHLHEWIDLVFGYKQIGKAAVEAINVFHPATYYGADGIDIDSVQDPTQQAAMRTMVKTYGQMPLLLFREAHPPRTKTTVLTMFRMRFGSIKKRFTATSPLVKVTNPDVWMHILPHKVKFSISNSDCDFIGAHGSADLVFPHLSVVDHIPEKIVCIGNSELIITDIHGLFFLNSSPAHSSLLVTWGMWDNSLIVRSMSHESALITLHPHPLNWVTCCECVCSGQMIVSGGTAGVVSFWQITNTTQTLSYSGKVVSLRGHDDAITCLAACKPFSIVVTGSNDKTCIIWDTNRLTYVNSLSGHEGPVTVIATSSTLGDIATVCTCKSNKQNTRYQCVLRIWTINGKVVGRVQVEVLIKCLTYTTAPEGVYTNILAGGLANGDIRLWSSWDLSVLRNIHCPLDGPVPVLSIAISSCSKELYAGYSNKQLVGWVRPKHDSNGDEGEYVNLRDQLLLQGTLRRI